MQENKILTLRDTCYDAPMIGIPEVKDAINFRNHPGGGTLNLQKSREKIYDKPTLTVWQAANHLVWQLGVQVPVPHTNLDYDRVLLDPFAVPPQNVESSSGRVMAIGLVAAFDEMYRQFPGAPGALGAGPLGYPALNRPQLLQIDAWVRDPQNISAQMLIDARTDLQTILDKANDGTLLAGLPARGVGPGEEAIDIWDLKWLFTHDVHKQEFGAVPVPTTQAMNKIDQYMLTGVLPGAVLPPPGPGPQPFAQQTKPDQVKTLQDERKKRGF